MGNLWRSIYRKKDRISMGNTIRKTCFDGKNHTSPNYPLFIQDPIFIRGKQLSFLVDFPIWTPFQASSKAVTSLLLFTHNCFDHLSHSKDYGWWVIQGSLPDWGWDDELTPSSTTGLIDAYWGSWTNIRIENPDTVFNRTKLGIFMYFPHIFSICNPKKACRFSIFFSI